MRRPLLALTGVLVGLALGEVALRAVWSNPWAFSRRAIPLKEELPNQDRLLRLDSSLLPHGESRIRTDADGFLLPTSIPGTGPGFTVAFLGGSTTECGLLPETERFPYLAARRLAAETGRSVAVLNAGMSGANTHNALNVFLNKILERRADIVLLMEANNDAGLLAERGSYASAMIQPEDAGFLELLTRRSWVAGLLRETRAKLVVERGFNELARRDRRQRDARPFQLDAEREARLARTESEFVLRLHLFVAMTRASGSLPVLMTQPHYLSPRRALGPDERQTWLGGLDHVERFNGHIRSVADNTGSRLVDLERAGLGPEDFYDHIHYSVAGSRKIAALVGAELVALASVVRPAASNGVAQGVPPKVAGAGRE